MKKKLIWIVLALAVLAALILVIVLPGRGGAKQPAEDTAAPAEQAGQQSPAASASSPEPEAEPEQKADADLDEGELPLDDTVPESSSSQTNPEASPLPTMPAVDPDSDSELEEDELPWDTP